MSARARSVRRACGFMLGLSGLISLSAHAIIMRDDVDEARYRALGDRYRSVLVALAIRAQNDGAPMLYSGMGTLIGSDWVITAAHAATTLLRPGSADLVGGEHFVFVKGRGYRVARVVMHPDWNKDGDANDIALIQLEHAVKEPSTVCVYDKADEDGKIVTLVGQGLRGVGTTGPAEDADGILRAATVRVDTVEPKLLSWIFRKPGDPLSTPLQGISGPGDSGGPALLEVGQRMCIVGVSSTQAFDVDVGQGHYGAKENYTRVSAFAKWIEATMKGDAATHADQRS